MHETSLCAACTTKSLDQNELIDSPFAGMESEPPDHTRPTTEDVTKTVTNRIRRNRGNTDKADEVELSKTIPEWRDDYRLKEKERRQILADYTKT